VEQVKELFPGKFPVESVVDVNGSEAGDDNAEVCSASEAKLLLDRIYSFLLFNNCPSESSGFVSKLRRLCKQEAVRNSKQISILDFLKK
jgi:hypothetical protein